MIRRAALAAALLVTLQLHAGSQAVGSRAAIATSSRFATQTGLEILRRGGNAADTAIAVAFALSVVQPEAASIGGGGTLVYYDAKSKATWTLDFRENAPAGLIGAVPRSGVAAIAVPSFVAGMDELHARFASRKWKDLLAQSIRAASGDLRDTLRQVASGGARTFYDGAIASRIVTELRKAGGVLSLHDLSEYKAVWLAPVIVKSGVDEIVSVPPPSAGGTMIAEMLSILGTSALKPDDVASIHLFAEAERRAAFDRDRFFADNATERYAQMTSDEHVRQLRASIDPKRATPTILLGDSPKDAAQTMHTTHFTIVDAFGNIAAVTLTLDDENGSGFTVPRCGFVLNDAAKNATRAGDRVPSSMTPAIVLRSGKPILALGSTGGAMIPSVVLQVIIGVTRFGRSLQQAIEAPRFDHQAWPEDITCETNRTPQAIVRRLLAMGHGIRSAESIGEVNAVRIEPSRLTAVADSRGRGAAGAM